MKRVVPAAVAKCHKRNHSIIYEDDLKGARVQLSQKWSDLRRKW